MRNMAPVSSKRFLLSQLRDFREADSELAEDEPCQNAESEADETIENAGVVLRLRLHDVDGLSGDVVAVLIFGH